VRLLAAVVAKNAVGSSWRKTVATREYSRLPEAERAGVRALALELLFAEPSPRVATQLSLLVTNVARRAPSKGPRLHTLCRRGVRCPPFCIARRRHAAAMQWADRRLATGMHGLTFMLCDRRVRADSGVNATSA
jgi:hypothetical protein